MSTKPSFTPQSWKAAGADVHFADGQLAWAHDEVNADRFVEAYNKTARQMAEMYRLLNVIGEGFIMARAGVPPKEEWIAERLREIAAIRDAVEGKDNE